MKMKYQQFKIVIINVCKFKVGSYIEVVEEHIYYINLHLFSTAFTNNWDTVDYNPQFIWYVYNNGTLPTILSNKLFAKAAVQYLNCI